MGVKSDSILRVAVQKSGRLYGPTVELIRECGIKFDWSKDELKASAKNFPIELLYLRDDDIPGYVADGIAHVGIVGQNTIAECGSECEEVLPLGFSRCHLAIAVPKGEEYAGSDSLRGKTIATSYPNILRKYLDEQGIDANIHRSSGSVEIAPGVGLSDAICDLVSTGSTLLRNGLREVERVMSSEAVLIAAPSLDEEQKQILQKLTFRINAVKNADNHKYIMLNAPNDALEAICALLPGVKSPTIIPLAEEGWSALHSVVNENDFWEMIERLRGAGARGLLVLPIEKMIA